jgi:sigma-B regulation protein RsbU (phosphoserine phosphatase)
MPALPDTLLILLQMACVVAVVAYLLTRSRFFLEFLEGRPSIAASIVTTGVFGLLSVYGTVSGVEVLGAPVNIRDLGPMVAGLACGPVVGIGAGLIGALYRISLGGFTVYACSLATVLAGALGGLVYIANRRQFLTIPVAVSFAVFMEGLHMLLVLGISTPFAAALELVSTVAAPMILANAAGMLVFSFIITNLVAERRTKAEKEDLVREIERKNAELRIAAEIQKSLLPETIPVVPGFEIAAASIPAREMDGDFYDMIAIGGDNPGSGTGLLIADVSG